MRWILLLSVFALAANHAAGQQAKSANETPARHAVPVKSPAAGAAAAGNSAPAPETVKVYEPRKPVVAPRLLPPLRPVDFPEHCIDTSEGESELSLLVDTKGQARNILFLRPSGTLADEFAIDIASGDRFAPGTLNGKPVVVAETLDVRLKACFGEEPNAKGEMEKGWILKAPAQQKLKKPKKPPEVAELAPLAASPSGINRKVHRPDFFGNGETAPVLIYSDYANYTPRFPGAKGTCQVSLVVDEHGLPEDLHVLKGIDPGLDMAALQAVSKYRFFPAIKDNKPVAAAVVVSVRFAPPWSRTVSQSFGEEN